MRSRANTPAPRIGTSGWHYAGWFGPFYPASLKKKDALAYYVTKFDCAELNAPFYRTPTEFAVETWYSSTPDNFRFAWKASRFITHWRRLIVDENSLALLASRAALLREKLGPVLFQLHPKMPLNLERLAGFLKRLPKRRLHTFEFRHRSWYEEPVFALLRDHNAALCISDHADAPAPWVSTADWVYVRNHGPSGRYHGSYNDAQLRKWAETIQGWRHEGKQVWCFFDNDVKSAAPADAARLLGMLE